MPIYASYASIYDMADQGRLGEYLAGWSLGWLAERDEYPGRVLDLACGTGAAALAFAGAGCQVLGLDQSRAMLEIARGKARDMAQATTFLEGDMRAVGRVVAPGFDLVACFSDSLNYLTGDADLAETLAGAAQVLRPGGWLIFDMNSDAEYATWDERDLVAYDSDDLMLYQRLEFDERTRLGEGKIGWFVRGIDRWWRGEETHTQRAWSEAERDSALAGAGLVTRLAQPVPGVIDGRRFVYCAQKGTA